MKIRIFLTCLCLLFSSFTPPDSSAETIKYLGTTPFYLNETFPGFGGNSSFFTDVTTGQGTTEEIIVNHNSIRWGRYSEIYAGLDVTSYVENPYHISVGLSNIEAWFIPLYDAGPTPLTFTWNIGWGYEAADIEHYQVLDEFDQESQWYEFVDVFFESSLSIPMAFLTIPELESAFFVLPEGLPEYTDSFESSGYTYDITLRNTFNIIEGAYAHYARELLGLDSDSVVLGGYWGNTPNNWYTALDIWLDIRVTSPSAAPTPEPATVFLMGAGLLGMLGMRKRFKK